VVLWLQKFGAKEFLAKLLGILWEGERNEEKQKGPE
jgi:hypothetical protein